MLCELRMVWRWSNNNNNKKAKDFWQKVQAAAVYITFLGSNIVILTVFHIFHSKNMTLVFYPSRSSKVKSDCANRKSMAAFKKVLLGVQPRIFTVFKIFRIKGLWPWPSTSQGHPKWSPWPLYIISVGSNIVTLAVLDIFYVKKYDLDFLPLKVI